MAKRYTRKQLAKMCKVHWRTIDNKLKKDKPFSLGLLFTAVVLNLIQTVIASPTTQYGMVAEATTLPQVERNTLKPINN